MRPLFALLLRSVRDDVRSRFTYVVRCLLVGLALFSMVTFNALWDGIGAGGKLLFGIILHVDLFILSIVGLTHFASAITEEKEADTLGLLRMTDLNGLAILMGKSSSRVIGAFLLIAAQLPFALVAVTFGGLHLRQVFAGFVLLLSFAFLTANVGLLASTLCRRSSTASLLTGLLLAIFAFGPAVFTFKGSTGLALWKEATPFAWREDILSTGFAGPIAGWPCAVHFLIGMLAFLLAWALFNRCSDAAPEAPAQRLARGRGAARTRSRAPMNAIHWKDFHYVSGGRAATVIKGLVVAALVVLAFKFMRQPWRKSEFYCLGLSLAFPSAVLLGISFSIDASRIFTTERRNRTMSSLLGLPMPVSRVVWEKVFGCLRTSLIPIFCLCAGLAILPCAIGWEMSKRWILPNDACDLICWILYGAAAMLSLPAVIAWLSLHVRWGAFALGLTLWLIGSWMIQLTLTLLMERAAISILPFVHLGILVFLALEIVNCLERLGGE
jgi:hypothetical protein